MNKELTLFDSENEAYNESFHNTTGLGETEAKLAEIDCKGQELDILNYFKTQSRSINVKLSPSDVHNGIWGNSIVPLTSVRRAITNLTKYKCGDCKNTWLNGVLWLVCPHCKSENIRHPILIKTNEQQKGIYGKPEHLWELLKLK